MEFQIPALLAWSHHAVMPWAGYVLVTLIILLGLRWLVQSLVRAWRSLKRSVGDVHHHRQAVRAQTYVDGLLEGCATEGLSEKIISSSKPAR